MVVAVLMGGPSREHEVSLKSGVAVCQNLNNQLYDVIPVTISLQNKWSIEDKQYDSVSAAINALKQKKVDVVFLALHGSFGEDGSLQALLSKNSLRFTGSNVSASLLAMDKQIASDLFAAAELSVPRSLTITRHELVKQQGLMQAMNDFRMPIIVKPASQGSSVGVSLVERKGDISAAIEFALEHDNVVLAQEYIAGREVSCGVLGNKDGDLRALPPTELKPHADFFDYYAKYTKGATDETTPPDMPSKTIETIQKIALQCHEILGCSGYSRTDMILKDKTLYVIETNTLPGLTETSILPQQAAAAGMTFSELLDQIIGSALTEKG